MKLSFYAYRLLFKYPFRIAHGMRSSTDVVYVKLEHEGFTAWGEAALPPYLLETQKSVIEFFTAFSENNLSNSIDDWFAGLKDKSENICAKAALDMALWDLKSQLENKSIAELLGIDSDKKSKSVFPLAAYTLGISSFDEMKLKIEEAKNFGFQFFKIKLNGENDEEVISNFKKLSDDSYAVDINGGWKNADEAMRKINWLAKHECLFVEQPLPKNSLDEMKLLKEKSALPLYADESCQRLIDLKKLKECFDGVNIKLMKCGGITEAHQMILKARELGLKVLIGCMSESSVGCTAAAHLTPLVDYADLDGPYLISNDPFEGMSLEFGTIQVNQLIQKVTL